MAGEVLAEVAILIAALDVSRCRNDGEVVDANRICVLDCFPDCPSI